MGMLMIVGTQPSIRTEASFLTLGNHGRRGISCPTSYSVASPHQKLARGGITPGQHCNVLAWLSSCELRSAYNAVRACYARKLSLCYPCLSLGQEKGNQVLRRTTVCYDPYQEHQRRAKSRDCPVQSKGLTHRAGAP
jgi:hypothetical protein